MKTREIISIQGNRSIYRIKELYNGWIVERLEFKYRLFGLHFYRVWRPYVKVRGMDESWNHSIKAYAVKNLLIRVREDTSIIDSDWD